MFHSGCRGKRAQRGEHWHRSIKAILCTHWPSQKRMERRKRRLCQWIVVSMVSKYPQALTHTHSNIHVLSYTHKTKSRFFCGPFDITHTPRVHCQTFMTSIRFSWRVCLFECGCLCRHYYHLSTERGLSPSPRVLGCLVTFAICQLTQVKGKIDSNWLPVAAATAKAATTTAVVVALTSLPFN